jgi:hypothetical protein
MGGQDTHNHLVQQKQSGFIKFLKNTKYLVQYKIYFQHLSIYMPIIHHFLRDHLM